MPCEQTALLGGKTVLIILRHANSLRIVQDYIAAHGGASQAVALDPIEAPNCVESALAAIRSAVPTADIVVAGTKVFDTVKDGPSRLGELLDQLQSAGLGAKPVCLTHLHSFTLAVLALLTVSPLTLHWCENDNLKRDGMTHLGPLILQAASAV